MADIVNQNNKGIYIKENNGTISVKYGDEKIPKLFGDQVTFIINRDFIGRKGDLERIRQIFFQEKEEIVLLSADAGIGKTGLASQYYKENENDYSHLVWLVSEPTINQKIQTLAKSVNVTLNDDFTDEQNLDYIYDKLRNLDKPTLLVVDDSDDYQDLKDTCPRLSSLNIHTLITTRINELRPYFVYGLGRLNEREAIQLFKTHYPLFDSNEMHILEQIITIAERNTLLIEIFAKNLESKNTKHEIRFSLFELKNTIEKGLHHIEINEEINVNHRRTKERSKQDKKAMSVLLALYDTEKLEEVEKKLLYIFTLLPKGEIHYQTLKVLTQEEQIDKQLQSLTRKGWLKENEENKTYSIKALVRDSISYRYKEGIQDTANPLCERISELIDDEGKNQEEVKQIIEIYLPLGKVVLENIAAISSSLSDTAFDLLEDLFYYEKKLLTIKSDYSISYEQLKSYIKQQEAKNEGNPSTALLEFYHVFVRVCEKEHKLLEAIEYQDLIIDIYRKFYNEDKKGLVEVLDRAGSLCEKYGGSNQLNKALEYRKEEYRLLIDLNSSLIRISKLYNNTAIVLKKISRKENLEQARKYLEQALTINIQYFGEDDISVAYIQSNLGLVLKDLLEKKYLEQSKKHLEMALTIIIQHLGESSYKVAIIQSNLALVLKYLGGKENLEKAKSHLKRSLHTIIQHFGEKNSIIAIPQTNLSLILQKLGGEKNLNESKKYLEKVLDIDIDYFGATSIEVAITQSNLTTSLIKLGGKENFLAAKQLIKDAYLNLAKWFPKGHPDLDVIFIKNVELYFLMERNEKMTEFPSKEEWQKIHSQFWEWFERED